jgi:DNA-binding SARP family transcriptional activator
MSSERKCFWFKLLGGCRLDGPDGPVTGRAAQRRRLAALALVAAGGAPGVDRERILALLWPEHGPEQARHLLADTLYVLRSALCQGAVVAAGGRLALGADVVECDLPAFDTAIACGDAAGAVALYGGPLLDGFHLPDAPEFERWAEAERERRHLAYAGALEALAREAGARGAPAEAAALWRRAAEARPYDGRLARHLVEALDAAGDRAGAVTHARVHAALLRADLDVAPDPALLALAERLRAPRPAPAEVVAAEAVTPPPPAPLVAGDAPSATSGGTSGGTSDDDPSVETGVASPPPPRARRWRPARAGRSPWALAIVAAVLVAVAAVGGWRGRAGRADSAAATAPRAGPRLVVTIAEERHDTADAALAAGFTEAVVAELRRDSSLFPVSPTHLRRTAHVFGFSPAALTRDTVEFLSRRLGTSAFVTLGVARAGAGFVLTAEATGAANNFPVGVVTRAAGAPAEIPAAVEFVAAELRRRIAGARGSLPPTVCCGGVAVVDDVSPLALQFYLRGETEFARRNFAEAARLYGRAVEADSTFAMGWRRRFAALNNSREGGRAERIATIAAAYRFRDRVRSPADRQFITGDYWRMRNDPERAIAAYDSMARLSGQAVCCVNQAVVLESARRPDLAEAVYRSMTDTTYRTIRGPHVMIVHTRLHHGQVAAARAELARMAAIDSTNFQVWRARLEVLASTRAWDALEERADGMRRRARSSDERTSALLYLQAAALAQGRIERHDSLGYARRALRLAPPAGARLDWELQRARVRAAVAGDAARARAIRDSALGATPWAAVPALDRPYPAMLLLHAALGERERAAALAAEWSRETPAEFRRIDSLDVLAGRAEAALAAGDGREALRLFRQADAWGVCAESVYPRYARAYDVLGVRDSAVLWYERYVARNQCPDDLDADGYEYARARRRLGELYEERGEWRAALGHYDAFLALRRRADPGLRAGARAVEARAAALRGRVR